MSKNILLPGGIGYIGSHVMVDLLLKTTYNITIIDNYLNSTQATLQRIYDAVATELDSSSLI
jgi:UDP-glucose 4-epimerase